MTSSAQLSPEGNWWWDSTTWRQVSPDRGWWWDGAQWRAFPATGAPDPASPPPSSGVLPRRMKLRYGGRCILCGTELPKGTIAMYHQPTATVRCVECPIASGNPKVHPVDEGVAGGSAYRVYERRKAIRQARIREGLGKTLGDLAYAIGGEAPSTTAWKRGSIGEAKVADALRTVDGVRVLSDRAPAGVFVIDAKAYRGVISVKDRGGFLQRDERLYVGGRDRSQLAENMNWQVEAVRQVLVSAGARFLAVPVQPVLCFVDGEWSLRAPHIYRGVRLEGLRSIKQLVTKNQFLKSDDIETITQTLSIAFPAK